MFQLTSSRRMSHECSKRKRKRRMSRDEKKKYRGRKILKKMFYDNEKNVPRFMGNQVQNNSVPSSEKMFSRTKCYSFEKECHNFTGTMHSIKKLTSLRSFIYEKQFLSSQANCLMFTRRIARNSKNSFPSNPRRVVIQSSTWASYIDRATCTYSNKNVLLD